MVCQEEIIDLSPSSMSRVIRSFYDGSFSKVGEELRLDPTESYHLAKVLRRSDGDFIELLNGKGGRAEAECFLIGDKEVRVQITKVFEEEKIVPQVTMVLAMTKGGKWEEQIKPLTELGVSRISPIITGRTEIKQGAPFDKKVDKWNKSAIEACKQSGNPWIPQIDPPVSLENYLRECKGTLLVAGLAENLNRMPLEATTKEVNILIGPEGGWTDQEEEALCEKGAHFFTLGRYTLRAETAALTALAVARSQFLD
jgi:16S rRNA (uracil1498-N3)-methyltransferase